MDTMNNLLADFYRTNQTKVASAADEGEQQKLAAAAQTEAFMKVAAASGYDVRALYAAGNTDLVDNLWNEFQGNLQKEAAAQAEFQQKSAAFPPPKKKEEEGEEGPKDKKGLEEKAKEEHEEKKAELAKIAMADYQGRVMAHSLVQELGFITSGSGEINKTAAAAVTEILKGAQALGGEKSASYFGSDGGSNLAKHVAGAGQMAAGAGHKIRNFASDIGQGLKDHKGAIGAGAAGAAAGAAAAKATEKKEPKEKEASAIDALAVPAAIDKVAAWIYQSAVSQGATEAQAQEVAVQGASEAAEKIAAADTLGLYREESVKTASAPDWKTAVDWRACELLEGAGYQITWAP